VGYHVHTHTHLTDATVLGLFRWVLQHVDGADAHDQRHDVASLGLTKTFGWMMMRRRGVCVYVCVRARARGLAMRSIRGGADSSEWRSSCCRPGCCHGAHSKEQRSEPNDGRRQSAGRRVDDTRTSRSTAGASGRQLTPARACRMAVVSGVCVTRKSLARCVLFRLYGCSSERRADVCLRASEHGVGKRHRGVLEKRTSYEGR
jgi:hypothetical protein